VALAGFFFQVVPSLLGSGWGSAVLSADLLHLLLVRVEGPEGRRDVRHGHDGPEVLFQGLEFRVQRLGFRVQRSAFRV